MTMTDWAWWLVAAVALALGELAVFTGFILAPLALAAAITAVAAALGAGIDAQLAVFAVFSIASVTLLRPIAKRHLSQPPELRTNAAALIGKEAIVLEAVTKDHTGLVRLEHENWTARPVDGVVLIAKDAHVKVVEIAGATAVVTPITTS